MAISRLQTKQNDAAGSTCVVTFDNPLTPGSVIVAFQSAYDNATDGLATPTRSDSGSGGAAFTAGTPEGVADDTHYRQRFWIATNSLSTTNLAVTFSGADFHTCVIAEYSGVDSGTQLDISSPTPTVANSASSTTRSWTGPATTPVTDGAWIIQGLGGHIPDNNPTNITEPTQGGTWTMLMEEYGWDTTMWGAVADFVWETADGTITTTWSATHPSAGVTSGVICSMVLRPTAGAAATREQEGFRFRNDDGSETTATWKGAQDSNVTSPLSANLRLRMLVNATNDPASAAYTLRYKKSTDSSYIAVNVGSTAPQTAPVIEGTAETAVSTAGTNHAITLPASIASTDLVLIIMDIGSTSATLNALTDWSEVLDESAANGLKILRYTGAGVPSNPTFVSSASTRSASIAYRISNVDKTITPQIGTTATGTSVNPNPPSVTPTGGTSKPYLFIAFFGSAGEEADDDTWVTAAPTNYTGLLQKSCGTAGTNLGGLIGAASRTNTSGSAEDPATFTMAVSAAWRAQTIIIHPAAAPAPPIYVSPSGNVTAGGEATTAQLTAPSGKTTSDFVTGRMWDDENGTDTIDITADDYTELEWSLQAQSPAVNTDIYQFRVYAGSSPLDTYTVTPEWTIGSAGTSITLTQASETDSGLTLAAASKTFVLGQAVETDSGLPRAGTETIVLGQASETDSAFPISTLTGFIFGQAVETDSGLARAGTKTIVLGQAVETDSGLTVALARAKVLTQATETDSALTITVLEVKVLTQASETDSALALVPFINGLFPATVSANGRYLEDQNGDPWFGTGDTAWSMSAQIDDADVTLYLEDRADKGFNLIVMSAPEHAFTDNTPFYENTYGDLPFTGTAFQSSTNDAYWDHVEFMVQEALRLEITVLICPAYLGFPGSDEGWNDEVVAASNAQMDTYGDELAARFGVYPNVMWLIGHDRIPNATEMAREKALADALQAGTSHLITAGAGDNGLTGVENWSGSGITFDFDTGYRRSTLDYVQHTQDGYSNSPTIPFGFFEGLYEGDGGTRATCRYALYGPLCAGACYVFFGNHPIWHFGSANWGGGGDWVAALDSGGSQDAARFATFMSTLGERWATGMAPDTTDTFLTAGEGSSTTKSAAMFDGTTTSGILALCYRVDGGSATLTFDLTELNQVPTVRVRKFDPTDGSYTLINTYATTGSQSIGSLGTNSAGDADWMLVFDAVGGITLGQAVETDSALALSSSSETKVFTQASETDSALTLTRTKSIVLGQAVDTESGLTMSALEVKVFGQATETDSGLPLTRLETKVLGQATETDSGLPLSFARQFGLGQAVESDLGLALDIMSGEGGTLDICVVFGSPVRRHEVGEPMFVPRSLGAPEFVVRTAGSPVVNEHAVGSPVVHAHAAELAVVEREAGPPATQSRSTTIVLGHGNPGDPTLKCEV